MKEIEHEKHAYVVRKGKNRKTKKKTTREKEGKREGILFYKKIPRIFSARGGVGRSRRPDCNRRREGGRRLVYIGIRYITPTRIRYNQTCIHQN